MEQEPLLNEHNKQEYPPMHTDRIDSSLMINIANIENACLEYKEEVFTSLTEAKKYLSEFDWCIKILDGWVAASFGYIFIYSFSRLSLTIKLVLMSMCGLLLGIFLQHILMSLVPKLHLTH